VSRSSHTAEPTFSSNSLPMPAAGQGPHHPGGPRRRLRADGVTAGVGRLRGNAALLVRASRELHAVVAASTYSTPICRSWPCADDRLPPDRPRSCPQFAGTKLWITGLTGCAGQS
jgi:hypothetical protein